MGVGVDLVPVSRVRRLLQDDSAAARDIFTAGELASCSGKRNRYAHLAARLAAKGAVLGALKAGLGPQPRWTDVEIRTDPLGRPYLHLHGAAAARISARGGRAEISLSHTGEYAMATAVVAFTGPQSVAGSA